MSRWYPPEVNILEKERETRFAEMTLRRLPADVISI
jgi:hypothetical protein